MMMFRRRPFRRPFRQAQPVGAIVQQALLKANKLNDTGEHVQAAAIFNRVASGLEARNRPNRAALIYLQAGHSLLLASEPEQAIELSKKGLKLLAKTQNWRAYTESMNLLVLELNQHGYAKHAAEIQTWVKQSAPLSPAGPSETESGFSRPETASKLPGKCPYCGATLRSDLVEWIDPSSVECPYCGSAVQTV